MNLKMVLMSAVLASGLGFVMPSQAAEHRLGNAETAVTAGFAVGLMSSKHYCIRCDDDKCVPIRCPE